MICSKDVEKIESKIRKRINYILSQGKKVIIDATNPSIKARSYYRSFSENIGIVWIKRNGMPFNQLRTNPVPIIAHRIYTKNFEIPSDNEGTIYELY